jgi:hypothetical protein
MDPLRAGFGTLQIRLPGDQRARSLAPLFMIFNYINNIKKFGQNLPHHSFGDGESAEQNVKIRAADLLWRILQLNFSGEK